jgi:glycosyltransferase involved in cell wall biosynthesis
MRVSLVCTVRDEADNIAALLDSMLAQTRPPDEIVINDCNSRDATPQIVQAYIALGHPIRLVQGGHNIASGRNNAVAHAAGPLIACTDAGLSLDPQWLERIVAPLERDEVELVGGFFQIAPQSLFELALGATNYRLASQIDGARFLPFGKSMAFRKEAWQRAGGFPDWLDHCEDVVFDRAVQAQGGRVVFVSNALVYFRPRGSLRAFARQYFFYARGDGMAGLWPVRHLLRYGVYGGLLSVFVFARRYPWLLLGPLVGMLAYTRAPLRRLRPHLRGRPRGEQLYGAALVPLIRLVGDCAKMAGYPVGLWRCARSGWRCVSHRRASAVPATHLGAPHRAAK